MILCIILVLLYFGTKKWSTDDVVVVRNRYVTLPSFPDPGNVIDTSIMEL